MVKSGAQVKTGKAFEYSLAKVYYEYILSQGRAVELLEDDKFLVAKDYYECCSPDEQELYDLSSRASVGTMLKLEPGLLAQQDENDVLLIRLAGDSEGADGDVRDVIFSRPMSGWEMGFSAKNNNDAVKHSRLSMTIDFGQKWLGYKVSDEYWKSIEPIFKDLVQYRKDGWSWDDMGRAKFKDVYVPILNAFMIELKKLDEKYQDVPSKLVKYLIGEKPFYKIIKDDSEHFIVVKAFNIEAGLNKTVNGVKPSYKVKSIELPSRIVEIDFMNKGEVKNDNTLDLIMDGGWEISFRIHNASTKVEPSLKFDVRLLGNPPVLFTQYIFQE